MIEIPNEAAVASAVEHATGAAVVHVERQLRWRPTWFVDAELHGNLISFVVRGDRTEAQAFPLAHEFTFHRLLQERGYLVPSLHGFTQVGSLDAMVMDRVPGRPDFDGTPPADRDAVVDEYLQQMARLHGEDPRPFVDAGISHPAEEDTLATRHRRRVASFRRGKVGPDPFMEFCLGWLTRNAPTGLAPAVPCIHDTGQFHHDAGHLVAILDLEFGQIGDPMQDLAVWRMRDTLIPFGNMRSLYARYEELSGVPVDLARVKWHHFAGTIGNQLMFGAAVAAPLPVTDVMTYVQWNSETNVMATEFLTEHLGVALPSVELPDGKVMRDRALRDHLVESLKRIDANDPVEQHKVRLAFRLTRHLLRRDEIGDVLDEQDIDDVHELVGGRRPEDWDDATAALERFVLADIDEGRHDETLAALFHKRNVRVHMTLGPPGSTMVRHYRCQGFDGTPAQVIQY